MSKDFFFSILFRLRTFWQKITQPTSRREDDARREYILCVLLIFLSALSILFTVSVASLATIPGTSPRGIPIWISVIISGLFLGLLYLARKGWWKFSSYAFLGLLIIPTLYSLTRWGTLLPIPLLTLSLIIVLIGILLNTRSAIIMAIALGSYLGLLDYAHQHNLISVDESWMHNTLYANYSMEITIILLVISGITWLAYQEIENSLRRARRSEVLVKKERDTLEERVLARTKELEHTQLERLKETSRLTEIGKLSAGLMHDLINPLTAVTMHIDQLSKNNSINAGEIREQINVALSATNQLSELIDRIRRELSNRNESRVIEIGETVKQAIHAVQYNANQVSTKIECPDFASCKVTANPLRLYRAWVNILTNAIESCAENPIDRERTVFISFTIESIDFPRLGSTWFDCAHHKSLTTSHSGQIARDKQKCQLIIKDTGCGIDSKLLPFIFDPFFSTKSERGIGLGLNIAQELLRQELSADISVESEPTKGTSFIISWSKN